MLKGGDGRNRCVFFRSHAVLTVHLVVERSREDASPAATTSKLNLVDLAGNEKSELRGGMGTDDDAIVHRQSCYINKSLTFLEQVRNHANTVIQ